MFKALKHPYMRWYLTGQFFSLIGTWMQQLAVGWLVYRLTHSPLWLGVLGFCAQGPSFILGLFVGIIVDRADLKKLLLWTQVLSCIQASLLAYLTLTQRVTLWQLISLTVGLGVINAIDLPTRQSFVIHMIREEKEDLPNAIALNSTVMNVTRLLGPAAAGMIVNRFGEGVCFLLNSVSYLGVLLALLCMKIKNSKPHITGGSIRESFEEGIQFVIHFKPISLLLILLGALSLVGAPFINLLPVMAAQSYHGGAQTLGFLSAATGLGAVGASIMLTLQKRVERIQNQIGACAFLFSISLILLSFSRVLPMAVIVLFLCGYGMLFQMAGSNIAIQTQVENDKRGRVMSLFNFALIGVGPFGSLFVGFLAEKIGLNHAFFICGCLYLGMAFWFFKRQTAHSENLFDKTALLA